MNSGRHRGYGFIYFKTMEGFENAMSMCRNPPYCGKRQLKIGTPEENNPSHARFDNYHQRGGHYDPRHDPYERHHFQSRGNEPKYEDEEPLSIRPRNDGPKSSTGGSNGVRQEV